MSLVPLVPADLTDNLSVRNWEFLLTTPSLGNLGDNVDPRKMLRRRSSLVVADLPIPRLASDTNPKAMGKPPPTVFEEPESSSLLDSFGF